MSVTPCPGSSPSVRLLDSGPIVEHATRDVVLVAGPPCAGKTTFVDTSRRPGDVVVDFDAIARGLGSPSKWGHSHAVGDAAEREFWRLVEEVGVMLAGRAWVVRCAPDVEARAELAGLIRATRVVVLLPPVGMLMRRARARPLPDETKRSIWRWLDRYAPGPLDEVINCASATQA